jgi:hypothetical protein
MGYFSNGMEAAYYEEMYCSKCVHTREEKEDGTGACPLWMAHVLHNYDECNNEKSILHELIPRSKNGLGNEQCSMFVEDKNRPDPNQMDMGF